MAENPLLPNRKLQELLALMQRCRALDRKQQRLAQSGRAQTSRLRAPIAREALLAATAMHLLSGDLLSAEPGDRTTARLSPAPKPGSAASSSLLAPPSREPRLLLCAAAATGLRAAGGEGLVLAYANVNSRPSAAASHSSAGWAAALEWAQSAQLPLLLACIDASGAASAPRTASSTARALRAHPSSAKSSATSQSPLDWLAMQRLAARLRLPVMPVDGEDAVAVYRVMQESAHRARMGGGPAVLWAIMSPSPGPTGLPRALQPIVRLRSYLAARGITLP